MNVRVTIFCGDESWICYKMKGVVCCFLQRKIKEEEEMKEEEVGSLARSLFNINDKFTNKYYQKVYFYQ
jgi:hypothetical protein